ncbi:hypothetical protein [Microbacterium sp. HJ5]
MDASTFTAYRLDQQRAADLDREHALRVSHRARHDAGVVTQPGRSRSRGVWSLFGGRPARGSAQRAAAPASVACPPCDPATLALAGPSS